MTDELSLTDALNDKLTDDTDNTLVYTEDHVFTFQDHDSLMNDVAGARLFIAASDFSTEEDRKALAKARALVNKLTAHRKAMLKEVQDSVFLPAKEQLDELTQATSDLITELKLRSDDFENKYRTEKLEEIEAFISDYLNYQSKFDGVLEPKHIVQEKWMNRTTTMKSIREQVDQIFSNVEAMTATTSGDVAQAAQYLMYNNWDLAQAITKYLEDVREAEQAKKDAAEAERQAAIVAEYDAQKAREAEEARRLEEARKAQAEQKVVYERVVVEIEASQVEHLRQAVFNLGGRIID